MSKKFIVNEIDQGRSREGIKHMQGTERAFTPSINSALEMHLVDPDVEEMAALLAILRERDAPPVQSYNDLIAFRQTVRQDVPQPNAEVQGPNGSVPIVLQRQDNASAVLINLHSGGWVLGAPGQTVRVSERLMEHCGLSSVSPAYRLAPEYPQPAGLQDVVALILDVVENPAEYGSDRIVLMGSSAGANLTALALVHLRDHRPDALERIAGAVMSYGCYDVTGTPSLKNADRRAMVDPQNNRQFVEWAFPGKTTDERRHPSISPLYADLKHLPPALINACESDSLFDDSLFYAARYNAAGNEVRLDVWRGTEHAFDALTEKSFEIYTDRVGEWISARLAES